MKKTLLFIAFILLSLNSLFAEKLKTVYNPFTGKSDYITALDSTTVTAGAGILVTSPSGVVIVSLDLAHANTWTADQTFNGTNGVKTANITSSTSGGALNLTTQQIFAGAAGNITIQPGTSLAGGCGTTNTPSILWESGNSSVPGRLVLTGAPYSSGCSNNLSGDVVVTGGQSGGSGAFGGNVSISAGSGATGGNGGNLSLSPGFRGIGGTTDGYLTLKGTSYWLIGTSTMTTFNGTNGNWNFNYGVSMGSATITSLSNTILAVNGSGIVVSTTIAAGGTPAGSTTEVQYRNGGSFGGDSTFTFDASSKTVNVSSISVVGIRASTITFVNLSGTAQPQVAWQVIPSIPGSEIGWGYNASFGNSIAYQNGGVTYPVFDSDRIRMNNSAGTPGRPSITSSAGDDGLYVDTNIVGLSESGTSVLEGIAGRTTLFRHVEYKANAPSISSCGATPNGSVVGNDNSGIITVGGGVVTACTLTFNASWTNIAICNVTDDSSSINVAVTTASASAITIGFGASLGGGKVYYQCTSYN